MAMVRTFVALEMAPWIDVLTQMQDGLRCGPGGRAGRWVRPERIHLTLRFLGDVPEEQLADVYAAVKRACQSYEPLRIRLSNVGCFPNANNPRVVWAGIQEETGQLSSLQAVLETELVALGFEREERPFRPHLTLARIQRGSAREEARQLGQAALTCPVPDQEPISVDRVCVIKSELTPHGAVYTHLYSAGLMPKPAAQGNEDADV
jgi:RNA 2',3'-cyclic 3'-phosphodiesterase